MKRMICLLLVITTLFLLCSCKKNEEVILEPVNFYYAKTDVAFGCDDGVIGAYVAESAGCNGLTEILQLYLKGCKDNRFHNIFPAGTTLKEATVQGQTAYITLTSDFARLSGTDLTIACACITMTTMELVDVTFVCINANGVPMDGSLNITLSRKDLILIDTTQPKDTQ